MIPTRTRQHNTTTAPPAQSRRRSGETGQTAILAVIALTALAIVLIIAIARLGTMILERSAAQTAADAAALAGVVSGRSVADVVAGANGAVIIAWTTAGHTVSVTVRLGDAVATARATDAP